MHAQPNPQDWKPLGEAGIREMLWALLYFPMAAMPELRDKATYSPRHDSIRFDGGDPVPVQGSVSEMIDKFRQLTRLPEEELEKWLSIVAGRKVTLGARAKKVVAHDAA